MPAIEHVNSKVVDVTDTVVYSDLVENLGSAVYCADAMRRNRRRWAIRTLETLGKMRGEWLLFRGRNFNCHLLHSSDISAGKSPSIREARTYPLNDRV